MEKKKVIIAEDNQFILRGYKLAMEEAGYEVQVVTNGADVIRIVDEVQPDILILDLILPRMNGFDILKELRASDAHADLPILVATSLGQEEDQEKVKALGATDYVVKPHITVHDLVHKVETLVGEA